MTSVTVCSPSVLILTDLCFVRLSLHLVGTAASWVPLVPTRWRIFLHASHHRRLWIRILNAAALGCVSVNCVSQLLSGWQERDALPLGPALQHLGRRHRSGVRGPPESVRAARCERCHATLELPGTTHDSVLNRCAVCHMRNTTDSQGATGSPGLALTREDTQCSAVGRCPLSCNLEKAVR